MPSGRKKKTVRPRLLSLSSPTRPGSAASPASAAFCLIRVWLRPAPWYGPRAQLLDREVVHTPHCQAKGHHTASRPSMSVACHTSTAAGNRCTAMLASCMNRLAQSSASKYVGARLKHGDMTAVSNRGTHRCGRSRSPPSTLFRQSGIQVESVPRRLSSNKSLSHSNEDCRGTLC